MRIVVRRGIRASHSKSVPKTQTMMRRKLHDTTKAKTTNMEVVVDVTLEERRGSSTGKWGAFN